MQRNIQDFPHPFLPSTPVTVPVWERSHAPLRTSREPKERRILSARRVFSEVEYIAENKYEKTNCEIDYGIIKECHPKQFLGMLPNIDIEIILPIPCHYL